MSAGPGVQHARPPLPDGRRAGPFPDDAVLTDRPLLVAGKPLPEHLVLVVAQLLTGATDVTASQRLGVSPRTFSRRVSELLECLGVTSRFQAGVAAVDQGWLVQRQHPQPRKH
jgi:DNA-binding NarL/FixJ family response regulator